MKKLTEYVNESLSEIILFADLDGTIIETKSGKTFGENKDDWQFKEDVITAIYSLSPLKIHIVTNQAGISKGYITEKDFISKIKTITKEMTKRTGCQTITYDYCSSEDKNDPNRKPNPGMINNYLKENNLKPENCIMIGDASGKVGQFSDSDYKAAEAAKVPYYDVDDFVKKYNK